MQLAASKQNHHGGKINQWSFKHGKTPFQSLRVEDFCLGDIWTLKNFFTLPHGGAAPALHHLSGRISDSGHGDKRRLKNGEEGSDARREDMTAGRRSCHLAFKVTTRKHSHIEPARRQSRSTAPPPPRTKELNRKPSPSNIRQELRTFHLVSCQWRGSYPQFSLSEHCAAFRLNEVE